MNKSLRTLFVFNGMFVFASMLLGPLYAVYVSGIDKSILAVSGSWGTLLISSTIFTLLMSKWGDSLKEKEYFLIAGYLIRGCVWLAYIFIGSFVQLLVLQFILGIGEALGTPSYDALFAEHLDKKKHITAYSGWKVISNIVAASATFIGGFIVSQHGFVPLFTMMSVLAFTCAIGIFLRPRKLL